MVASHAPPTGDLAHNPGMCPDWESNGGPLVRRLVLNPLSHASQGPESLVLSPVTLGKSLFPHWQQEEHLTEAITCAGAARSAQSDAHPVCNTPFVGSKRPCHVPAEFQAFISLGTDFSLPVWTSTVSF